MQWLKCLVGYHKWEIYMEIPVDGNDSSDYMEFTSGGRDYHSRCQKCNATEIRYGRGFWIAPKYPRSKDFTEGESYVEYNY
jgi:hypothetical protein